MPRDLRERARDWRWWGEQVAHQLAGLAIAALVAVPVFIGRRRRSGWVWVVLALVVGISTGIAREVVQNWGDAEGSVGDSVVDAIAWGSGAAFGSAVALAVWLSRREEDR